MRPRFPTFGMRSRASVLRASGSIAKGSRVWSLRRWGTLDKLIFPILLDVVRTGVSSAESVCSFGLVALALKRCGNKEIRP